MPRPWLERNRTLTLYRFSAATNPEDPTAGAGLVFGVVEVLVGLIFLGTAIAVRRGRSITGLLGLL
jgi:hypothetical protein